MPLLRALRAKLTQWASLTSVSSRGGWLPIVREPYMGAWQANQEILAPTAFQNWAVFGCVTRIAGDISNTPLLLWEKGERGIRTETTNPAYSALLRRPNRYQTQQQFLEQWMLSKLLHGNTYALIERDERTVPQHLYLLDPTRVQALVAPDGSVYYQLHASDLAGVPNDDVIIPAREIIHDRWNCAFHPLQGLPPLYAAAAAVLGGGAIQKLTLDLFASGGRPAGVLLVPRGVTQEIADDASTQWKALGPGKTMILPEDIKFQDVSASAVDSQLAQQLGLTEEQIATVYSMPINQLNSAKQPPYANAESSQRQYTSQTLKRHFSSIATSFDDALSLPSYLEVDFDYDDLIWLDTPTKTEAAKVAVGAGIVSINEARRGTFGLEPVEGGDIPLVQQQYYPLGTERPAPVSSAPRAEPVAP